MNILRRAISCSRLEPCWSLGPVLLSLTACVAPPSEAAVATPETLVANRISLRDAAGKERIVLDADDGILLRNARGNPVCKLQLIGKRPTGRSLSTAA